MGLWSIVSDKLGGKNLPSYQFSRDERIFKYGILYNSYWIAWTDDVLPSRSFTEAIDGVSRKLDYTLKLNKATRTTIETTIRM